MSAVSIVVPMHNAGKTIGRCLESILNQTLDDIEIICVDDASTDNTVNIVSEYKKKDSRIVLLCNDENCGSSMTRKIAVEHGTGEYFMFVDSDDYIDDGLCQEALDGIQSNKCDILRFGTIIECESIDEKVKGFEERQLNDFKGELSGNDIVKKCFYRETYTWNLWNKIFNKNITKKAFKNMDNDRLILGEDLYVYFIMAFHSNRFVAIDSQNKYHYCYGNGGTAGINKLSLERFRLMNNSSIIAPRLKKYSIENNKNFDIEINFINEHLMEHIQCIWVDVVDEADRDEAFKIMIDAWGEGQMAKYYQRTLSYYRKHDTSMNFEIERLNKILLSKKLLVKTLLYIIYTDIKGAFKDVGRTN
jgi:glycosyltransferase involved in cell wall biosynthesis